MSRRGYANVPGVVVWAEGEGGLPLAGASRMSWSRRKRPSGTGAVKQLVVVGGSCPVVHGCRSPSERESAPTAADLRDQRDQWLAVTAPVARRIAARNDCPGPQGTAALANQVDLQSGTASRATRKGVVIDRSRLEPWNCSGQEPYVGADDGRVWSRQPGGGTSAKVRPADARSSPYRPPRARCGESQPSGPEWSLARRGQGVPTATAGPCRRGTSLPRVPAARKAHQFQLGDIVMFTDRDGRAVTGLSVMSTARAECNLRPHSVCLASTAQPND